MKTFQILSFLLAILCVSCTISSIEDFVVGENFIKDNTGVVMIDTMTIKTSTVKFDSIFSNSSGRFLVGSNYNTFSGFKNSNSFLEMMFDDEIGHTKFIFDSLNMVLSYDTYSFGDTTVSQTFTIHQLQEEMELGDNGYLYTTSKFAYNSVPLGSITFKPKPNSHKKVSIRLSDKFGKRLSDMIKDQKDTITNSYLFAKFFKGLVIKSQSGVKGAVVGFRTTGPGDTSTETTTDTETKPEFRLYYHLSPNPDNLSDLYYKFSYNSDGIYFNQVSGDESNSLIDGISKTGNERASNLTNKSIIVQSGVQLFSKFQFPYIDNLLLLYRSNSAFVGATLRLYPIKGTYKSADDLPDSLYVYSADRKNQLTAQTTLLGSTSKMAFGRLVTIRDVEEISYYEIDISSYIDTELKEQLEINKSLMIGFGSSTANKTASHVVFGGQNSGKYAPLLRVYYYHN
jgi:hypothetical protein